MAAYYNEIEPYAAEWLRNLIKGGHIADGEVDTRSIIDVQPAELAGYTQCHFFAGIGGWSHALRLAGWPDERPIWTGSAPCQPFSVAGKRAGTDDPRHLWPHFHRLISTCRPPVVMGEQVAGKAGYGWLDGVRADLAREDYASRGVDIPACAVDAPHIRSRLYWVAEDMGDTNSGGRGEEWERGGVAEVHRPRTHARVPPQERGAVRVGDMADGVAEDLGNTNSPHGERSSLPSGIYTQHYNIDSRSTYRDMADASDQRCEGVGLLRDGRSEVPEASGSSESDMADASDNGSSFGPHFDAGRTEDERRRDDDLRGEHLGSGSLVRYMADTDQGGRGRRPCDGDGERDGQAGGRVEGDGVAAGCGEDRLDMADADYRRSFAQPDRDNRTLDGTICREEGAGDQLAIRAASRGANGTFWSDHIWLTGSDGKARRSKPGLPLLAHGVPNRVGKLRAYGNAIVPPLAAEVIRAYMDNSEGEIE
jgi:site-specific DNA-cytosine methylase